MKLVLLANGKVGLEVCKYLVSRGENIYALVVPGQEGAHEAEIQSESGLKQNNIFLGNVNDNNSFIEKIKSIDKFILITVYWPWLLKESVFSAAEKTINFHPAPLPINRGWYPHVHSIIDGTPAGVTLHAIEKDADTGPIWAKKIIDIMPEETAYDIYNRLQSEILNLFVDKWDLIKRGEIKPYPQEGTGNYHKKKEIEEMDLIDLDKRYKARDFINLLRARSFGPRGFAYFLDGDEKIFLRLNLERELKK